MYIINLIFLQLPHNGVIRTELQKIDRQVPFYSIGLDSPRLVSYQSFLFVCFGEKMFNIQRH